MRESSRNAENLETSFTNLAVGAGGMTGMLALNGLFILVTKHGLEYPAFYRRLYGLLTLDAFQVPAGLHRRAAAQDPRMFAWSDVGCSCPAVFLLGHSNGTACEMACECRPPEL